MLAKSCAAASLRVPGIAAPLSPRAPPRHTCCASRIQLSCHSAWSTVVGDAAEMSRDASTLCTEVRRATTCAVVVNPSRHSSEIAAARQSAANVHRLDGPVPVSVVATLVSGSRPTMQRVPFGKCHKPACRWPRGHGTTHARTTNRRERSYNFREYFRRCRSLLSFRRF
jgi:hypothetical protein